MKLLDHFKKLKNLYKILIIVAVVIASIACWVAYDNRSRPLGSEMVYLGKKNYGCWIGLCDAKPNAVLYYGTDIDPSQIGAYFDATPTQLEGIAFDHASLTTKDNGSFFVTYETTKKLPTTKKYVISLLDTDYRTAKESLKKK